MCPFTVRVHTRYCLAVFLGSMVTGTVRPPGGSRYYQVRHSRRICLPRVYLHLSTGCSVSPRPCHCSVPASPVCPVTESLPFLPFGSALRLPLRSRLTLIRLALIRNPWPCGVGVSRPHCRYLCLHLLFRTLQRGSRHAFDAVRNAPLPMAHIAPSHGFGTGLMPDYYPRPAARPVSCYALFE